MSGDVSANNPSGQDQRLLDESLREAIRAHLPNYETSQAVTLPALQLIQRRLGYVPVGAVVELAELLELHPAQVQDTLSFYGFFKQDRPLGRVRVWVCRSVVCASLGGDGLLEYLFEKLEIAPGETTPDGSITLEVAECLGVCEGAPALLVDAADGESAVHTNLTREKIDELIDEWRAP